MTEAFIQRYPWLAYLFIATGCLAVAGSAYYVDTAYANGYNAGYNDSFPIAYEQGVEDGTPGTISDSSKARSKA